jgi:hypothetical protein
MKITLTNHLFLLGILLFPLLPIIGAGSEDSVRIELKDGTVVFGKVSEKGDDQIEVQTHYGALLVPAEEVVYQEESLGDHVVYESWTVESLDGSARARSLVLVPEGNETIRIPVADRRTGPTIQSVTTLGGDEIAFETKTMGPLLLLILDPTDLAESRDSVYVEIAYENALSVSADGTVTLVRQFTPQDSGAGQLKVTGVDGIRIVTAEGEQESSTARKELRRQEAWKVEFELVEVEGGNR